MQIIIHGGMHKTGTSTLQALLGQNRQALAAAGIHYPDAPGGNHWQFFGDDAVHEGKPRAALEDARALGAETLLLSGEIISAKPAATLEMIVDAFDGAPIRFVFAFRDPCHYLPSRWSQYCRRRDSARFNDYLAFVANHDSFIDGHYDRVIERAARHGEVTAVSYDRAVEADGDAVPALLRALGVEEIIAPAVRETPIRRINHRQDWRLTEISRLLNGALADRRGLPQDELFPAFAAMRPAQTLFDLQVARLPVALRDDFFAALDEKATLVRLDARHAALAGNADFAQGSAQLFANADDGRIFPACSHSETRTTNFIWQSFQAAHPQLVATAIELLTQP
ncbi:hypothetical protein [Breoghania sp.]|uniref:hypothetical protein n=1 Tax=Breoghania sp. TaxID=2065378 RepID=UPI0029C9E70C|nr:hypothetical protein [Breoghania sp.]